jgi:hypothetical protein
MIMRNLLLLTIIGAVCVPMLMADPAQAQANADLGIGRR